MSRTSRDGKLTHQSFSHGFRRSKQTLSSLIEFQLELVLLFVGFPFALDLTAVDLKGSRHLERRIMCSTRAFSLFLIRRNSSAASSSSSDHRIAIQNGLNVQFNLSCSGCLVICLILSLLLLFTSFIITFKGFLMNGFERAMHASSH